MCPRILSSTFNHITLRVPGPETIFLINPFGLHYNEVTASNLVAVDIQGRPVRPADQMDSVHAK